MRRVGFRARLLIVLALFAVVPSAILTVAYVWSVSFAVGQVSGAEPWERVARTGRAALEAFEKHDLTAEERRILEAHRDSLSVSLTNARRLAVYTTAAPTAALVVAAVALLIIGVATVRVAGHLSRQLSRPLKEVVGWTEMIARGEALPEVARGRGAPEFEILRQRMRRTARELTQSRARALEAERLRAFRESARQVAHELKNLLTPIRFALRSLQRNSTPEQATSLEVLGIETQRMENIARSFSLFGKLTEGIAAEVDIAELVGYTARSTVPEHMLGEISIEAGIPHVRGHHDALSGALANILLNAVDACGMAGASQATTADEARSATPQVSVSVRRSPLDSGQVEVTVSDNGCGIAADLLPGIWDPYVTHKQGGTGLGLTIVRQTIEAHGGSVFARSDGQTGSVVGFTVRV